MKFISGFVSILFSVSLFAQGPLLQAGSHFPDLIIRNISNAPMKEIDLNKTVDKKLYLLNFWGTWCSPCIPEMDALAKLQKDNGSKLQVIAISDDSPERKQKYAANKPSGIWLATDTGYTLYNMLGLASVGNCAVVNADKKIVALLKSDSITQQTIDKLVTGGEIASNAYLKEPPVSTKDDAFGIDSLLQQSVSVRGYMQGQPSMGKRYITGPFKGRRISWFNVPVTNIYQEAYHIYATGQQLYDSSVSKKEMSDFENKSNLFCVDVLVSLNQSDSLDFFLQKALAANLPIKVRQEERILPVYVLKKRTDTTLNLSLSKAAATSYSFSGHGFEGQKTTLAAFANNYLANELRLPVVDETGLTGEYDITTTVDLRTEENVRHSVILLGLMLEKAERKIPVIVYYR